MKRDPFMRLSLLAALGVSFAAGCQSDSTVNPSSAAQPPLKPAAGASASGNASRAPSNARPGDAAAAPHPALAAARAAAVAPRPAASTTAVTVADPANELAAAAERQAQKLSQAMAATPPGQTPGQSPGQPAEPVTPAAMPRPASSEVVWIDTRPAAAKPASPAPAATPPVAAKPPAPVAPAAPPPVAAAPAPKPAVVAAPLGVSNNTARISLASNTAGAKPLDRGALVARLMDEVRRGDDPALNKAMAAAALSLVDPARSELDPADLAGLTPAQTAQVYKFHELVTALRKQSASGQGLPDAKSLSASLEGIRSEPAVHIRNLKLCRRVSGFGSYDLFDTSAFLAGREQSIVVYVELDQYRSTKGEDDQFHVRLNQEVTLYSESDGLAVWRQPAVEVKDQSFNRRKDFFVVQIIRLPARLSVGKYRLKVRVTDQADASIDESSVPLQVVADPSLISVRAESNADER